MQSRTDSEPARILVVDDERPLVEALRFALEREGYRVIEAYDGASALERGLQEPLDLVILDVMLPEMSGFEVCRLLRRERDIPILLLTARTDETDRVVGLDLGADDYIPKPFSMRELLARVRAALRRYRRASSESVQVGDLVLDPRRHEIRCGDRMLPLAPKEYELLALFMRNAGAVLSRDQLIERVWGYDYTGDERTVDVHVSWLRRKLREAGSGVRLVAVRGVGYRLEA
ncbi:MAG: response regulator transcription factor [Armatimonadota bacterium]|nr:response regulator transcription factor [Armatimonadota bacterium]MDR7443934.1 response regulator transcription factor [Armatimonadota bacterium]MDR7570033.1 response regulator transcription factor [Armatimonadota bacterium]MDR7613207.1 response regulator transcription factor [Armatimonadota bacterium]